MKMPLFDASLIAEWTGGIWKPGMPSEIRGLSTDTRNLSAGSLFVAIKGPRFDGHDFLDVAFRKGAAAAMVSRFPASAGCWPLILVKDTTRALRKMATRHRLRLGAEIIAVTGSVGKTTVKEMIAEVMSLLGPTARTFGNWNNEIGLPLSLLAVEESARFGVFEVGTNHPGELRRLCEILSPDWGVVTSVSPVHLEFFDSVRSIALEKSSLPRSLPVRGTAVLRKDQDWFELLRQRARCRVVTLAMQGPADVQGIFLPDRQDGMRVVEPSSGESFDFRLPLPGRHMAEDALFAIAVGRLHGLKWEEIAKAIASFKPQPMRWERVCIDGVTIINDAYNANPASMSAALQTFARLRRCSGKWLVLGGMRELGKFENKAHLELGIQISEGAWAGLLTVGRLGGLIAKGAEKGGMDAERIFRCRDASEAARLLKKKCAEGDSVLLKASRGEHLETVLDEWRKMQ